MAAVQIPLTWRLRQNVTPKSGANQVDAFNPSRLVKVEPSNGGPDGSDVLIVTRVLYNEGQSFPIEYHVEDTVAEVIALANANVIAT